MSYGFDRLGFLQFEQLVAALLELEGGIAVDAWLGEADRCRSVLSGSSLGRPLVSSGMEAPVLVQCAWVRSGDQQRLLDSVRVLVSEHSEDFAVANSFVLVTNLGVSATFAQELGEVLGRSRVRAAVLGLAEVGARVE